MIKKNTKIFCDGKELDWAGGIPLAKNDEMSITDEKGKTTVYLVKEKKVECFLKGSDQEVNITYELKKK